MIASAPSSEKGSTGGIKGGAEVPRDLESPADIGIHGVEESAHSRGHADFLEKAHKKIAVNFFENKNHNPRESLPSLLA